MNNLLAGYAADVFEPYAIWITVGIFGALLITNFILFFTHRQFFGKSLKFSFIGFVAYALIIGITLLIMTIIREYDTAMTEYGYDSSIIIYVFLPILISLIAILAGGVVLFIVSKKNSAMYKKSLVVICIICGITFIVAIVLIALYFTKNIAGTDDGINSAMLYVSAGLLLVLAITVVFFSDRKGNYIFDTRCISFAGISVALSFTLSYIKLWQMPQGGAITLASMLPVMIFSYVYGTKKGMLVGLVVGILQAVQDPYIVHPAQFLLDYPVAFSMVGLAGALKHTELFKNLPQVKFAVSAIIGATLRFVSHVLSGVFAFASYAGEKNALSYSLVYNSFVFIDIAIVIVVGVILFSSKAFTTELEKLSPALYSSASKENTSEEK